MFCYGFCRVNGRFQTHDRLTAKVVTVLSYGLYLILGVTDLSVFFGRRSAHMEDSEGNSMTQVIL